MLFNTRLSQYVNKIFYNLKRKVLTVQNSFSFTLFSLFIGFLCGNLFGTFLDTLRIYFFWNGFIGLILLLCIEIINFLVYGISFSNITLKNISFAPLQIFAVLPVRRKNRKNLHLVNTSFLQKNKRFSNTMIFSEALKKGVNAFKIGLLFGFFIDSFKVGS